jgi:hypothetical protein
VEKHTATLRAERVKEPARFQSGQTSSQKAINRIATRKVNPNESSGPSIQFKGVQVKQIDDNVAQLRATHSNRQAAGPGASESAPGEVSASGTGGRVVKPSIDLLNSVVLSKLEGDELLKRFDPRKDAMISFVDNLTTIPDDVAATVFNHSSSAVGNLIAENCLASPKEFWQFFSICWNAISKTKPETAAFQAVMGLLQGVGSQMVIKDQYVPFALLNDFGLPKIFEALKSNSQTPHIICILYAFSLDEVDEHVSVIRRLRDGLDSFETFIACLASLIRLETVFTTKLLDLYLYYIVAGLRHPSPVIRATAINMLDPIARATEVQGHKHVINLFDRLEELSLTDNWQVKSAVLNTTASLLQVNSPKEQLSVRLYSLMERLAFQDSLLTQQTAVVAMSRCLGSHPTIADLFIKLVTEYPVAVDLAMGYEPTGFGYVRTVQDAISSVMDRKAVAVALAENINREKPDNMEHTQIRLLEKCVEGLAAFALEDVAEWIEVYQVLRDHLVVELYDPSTCKNAINILQFFLQDSNTQPEAIELLTAKGGEVPPLYGILKLLYPEGDDLCKDTVSEFLGSLVSNRDSLFPSAVYKLLMNFSKQEPDRFGGSELEPVLMTLVETN